jgi:glucose-1-phosphate thymidylyltransferase
MGDMKGVILAGGRGTRLRPTTDVMNKHLIPIYDKPMIFHPIRTLIDAGIDNILIISSGEYISEYTDLLDGRFDVDFQYRVQTEPKGIAHAISLAEDFVDGEFVVLLGDNLIFEDLSMSDFELNGAKSKIFLKEVDSPSDYGIAVLNDGDIVELNEKPESPQSNHAVIGIYCYSSDVFSVIDDLQPSSRGEYEITDVNSFYLNRGELDYEIIQDEWFDAGTPEGIFKAAELVCEEKTSNR